MEPIAPGTLKETAYIFPVGIRGWISQILGCGVLLSFAWECHSLLFQQSRCNLQETSSYWEFGKASLEWWKDCNQSPFFLSKKAWNHKTATITVPNLPQPPHLSLTFSPILGYASCFPKLWTGAKTPFVLEVLWHFKLQSCEIMQPGLTARFLRAGKIRGEAPDQRAILKLEQGR